MNSTIRRFSFDKAATWILVVTTVLALVAFIPGGTVSLVGTKVTLLFIGALLAFIAFVVGRLVTGSITLPPLALFGAMWLPALAYLLSTLFSGTNPVHAFFGLEFEVDTFGFVLLLSLLGSLAALILRKTEDYKKFFAGVGIGIGLVLLVQVLFIVLAAVSPGLVSPADNVVGAFADIGMLSVLGIALALVSMRFFSFSKRIQILLWIGIAVALLIIGLINSVANAVIVGLVALALFIEGMMHRRKEAGEDALQGVSNLHAEEGIPSSGVQGMLAGPLVVLVVSVFFLVGGSVVGNTLAGLTGINVLDVRPSWSSTFDIGGHTYASSPLFGSGPGTFSEQWLMFHARDINDTIFWNVDFTSGIGYIPTSFVTTGAVGVLAWLVLLALLIYAGVRSFLYGLPEDRYARYASLIAFTGAVVTFLLAFLSNPGPVVLVLAFLLLGVFVSTLRYRKDKTELGILFSRSPRLGFVLVFVLTLLLLASVVSSYTIVERYAANATYGEAFRALQTGNLEGAKTQIARSLSFAETDRTYRLAASISVEEMRRIASDSTLDPSVAQDQFQRALSTAIAAGLEATRIAPNDYENWIVLGNVYQSVASLQIEGAYESAKDAYFNAQERNPQSPVVPFIMAQLELGEGNTAETEEQLLAAISLKRDYIPAILLLSQLKVQQGQAREALEAAEAAAFLAPNDASVLLSVGLLRLGVGDTAGAVTALSRSIEINPQYANARFFLAAIHANQGRNAEALEQLRTIAALSEANAEAVAADIAALEGGQNPFPTTRLRSLGIPQPPVSEPQTATE